MSTQMVLKTKKNTVKDPYHTGIDLCKILIIDSQMVSQKDDRVGIHDIYVNSSTVDEGALVQTSPLQMWKGQYILKDLARLIQSL